jgi:predicted outer membrane repeat protein
VNFTLNKADGNGGAICIYQGATCNINCGSFLSNTAVNGAGGAIHSYNTNVIIRHVSFTLNFGQQGGGAIANDGILTTVTVTYANFTSNSVPHGVVGNGGAIGNSGTLTVKLTNFTSNSAFYGGAIHNTGDLTVKYVNFTLNKADSNGGAIYQAGSLSYGATCNIDGGSFLSNTAVNGGGGAINSDTAHVNIRYVSFTLNVGNQGGAIYLTGGNLEVSGALFTGNNAAGVQYFCGGCGGTNEIVTGCSNNKCGQETCHTCFGQGGAMALFGDVSPNISSTLVHHNRADNYAGGLYLDGSVKLGCHTCNISENSSPGFPEDNVFGPPVHYICDPGFKTGNPSRPACIPCAFGEFSADGTYPFCSSCPAGKYAAGGSAWCPNCVIGAYSSAGASACSNCPIGKFSEILGSAYCTACPEGKYQSSISQGSCEACPASKFQAKSSQTNCSVCEKGQYPGFPTGSSYCIVPPAGIYVLQNSSALHSCPKASSQLNSEDKDPFNCTDGTLAFEDNFWHDGLIIEPGKTFGMPGAGYIANGSTNFYSCGCHATCCKVHPVLGSVSCDKAYSGLLCSTCAGGYFKDSSTGDCIECGDWTKYHWPILAPVLAVLLVLVWYWKVPGCSSLKSWIAKGMCCPDWLKKYAICRRCGSCKNILIYSYDKHLKVKIRLLVGFYQVSSLLHASYLVPYPYEYLHIMSKLKFFSVDFTLAQPGPCVFAGYNFVTRSIVIFSVAFAMCLCAWALIKSFLAGNSKPWVKKAIPWLPTVLFFTYPGFTAQFVAGFKCREINGNEYLTEDLSIECIYGQQEYLVVLVLAIFGTLIWAVGLPLSTVVFLWPERSKLQQGLPLDGLRGHLTDFHSQYKPQCWFFGGIEYGMKLLLIGIIPAASKGELWGAVVALFVTVAYLVLLVALSPYYHRLDHVLAVGINAMLFTVIQLSVLLKMDAAFIANLTADGISPGTAAYLLVASNVAVVILSVVGYIVSIWKAGLLERPQAELLEEYKTTSIQEHLLEDQHEPAGPDDMLVTGYADEDHQDQQ